MPTWLQGIINRALEKDPSLRYQHAAEVHSDLQQLKRARRPVPQPRPSVAGEEPATARPRGRMRSITSAAILLALALIAGYLAARGNFAMAYDRLGSNFANLGKARSAAALGFTQKRP